MSIDKSLKSKAGLSRRRNVLTRAERLEKLTDDGKWSQEESIFGLPKVRVARDAKKAKARKEAAEGAEAEKKGGKSA